VTGEALPLWQPRVKQGWVSGFQVAWSLRNLPHYGRKPCSLIVLTL
jgi:hypothetical protein